MEQHPDVGRNPESPPTPDAARRGLCGAGALTLLLSACGGGGGYGGSLAPAPMPAPAPAPSPAPMPAPAPAPGPAPAPALACGAVAISANHGHVLSIPASDLDSTVSLMYDITGSADHSHTILLTPAQLQQIKAKAPVTVASSVDLAHFHDVTTNCA